MIRIPFTCFFLPFFNITPRKFKIIYVAGIIFFWQHWSSPLNRRKDSNSEHLNSVAYAQPFWEGFTLIQLFNPHTDP